MLILRDSLHSPVALKTDSFKVCVITVRSEIAQFNKAVIVVFFFIILRVDVDQQIQVNLYE